MGTATFRATLTNGQYKRATSPIRMVPSMKESMS